MQDEIARLEADKAKKHGHALGRRPVLQAMIGMQPPFAANNAGC